MVASIPFNPLVTTNGLGSFNITTTGYIQGTALDQPAIRFSLAGGVLDTSETLPMWGGVGIAELIPGATGKPAAVLGGPIVRANSLTGSKALTGFSVFDQDHAMINTPQSPVPTSPSGGQVNFYRLGSGARIAVQCDPSLVSLDGSIITSQVSWDFTSQLLVPYTASYGPVTISGASWANTSGGQTTFVVGTDLTAILAAGDDIDVSGVVSTGGTGAGFNGFFTVVSVPDSTHVVVSQPSASSPGTYSSGGQINAAGGALPVKVLDINVGNSMTVLYSSVTQFATWNRSGSCAVILI